MTMISALCACLRTASYISRVVTTSTRRKRLSDASAVILPHTSMTCAPRSAAALAMAIPIFPLERLPIYLTGSMGSIVPPAVTRTVLPSRSRRGYSASMTACSMTEGAASRPSPTSPQASIPFPYPLSRLPARATVFRSPYMPPNAAYWCSWRARV